MLCQFVSFLSCTFGSGRPAQIHDCSMLPDSTKSHFVGSNGELSSYWRQKDHGACVLFGLGNSTFAYPVEMVVGMILKSLRTNAERKLSEDIRQAVITIPAYFTENQRSATRDAARIAGFEVLRLLPEPTAAALALTVKQPELFSDVRKRLLVFDLGGGTLDVSILSVSAGVVDVEVTGGDNRCGGNDVSVIVANELLTSFQKKYPASTISKANGRVWNQLLAAAEQAKRTLSFSAKVDVVIPQLDGTNDLQEPLSRARFEELCKQFFGRLIPVVEKTLQKASLKPADIDVILLAGGSSRIPRVQQLLTSYFNKNLTHTVNPDEAIAQGAAILAYKLRNPLLESIPSTTNSQSFQGSPTWTMSDKIAKLRFQDVTSHSLGIEVVGDEFSVLIKQFSKLPAASYGLYTTVTDYQPAIRVVVLEGEAPKASVNAVLGTFLLEGIERALRGMPSINVTFVLDENGILVATAKDTKTDASRGIVLDNVSWRRLSDAEADWMRQQADDLLRHGSSSRFLRLPPSGKSEL